MEGIQLVGPQVEQALRWLLLLLFGLCVVILKRWFDKALAALERIPEATWFANIEAKVETLTGDHEIRITVLEERRRHDRRQASLKA